MIFVVVGLLALVVVLALCVLALWLAHLHEARRGDRLSRQVSKLAGEVRHLTLKTSRVRTGEMPAVRANTPPAAPGTTPIRASGGRHYRVSP